MFKPMKTSSLLLFSSFSSVSELKPGYDPAGPVPTDEGWPGIQIEDLEVNGDIDVHKFTVITLGRIGSALAVTFLVVRKGAA
jgi:hypothetical protein